MILESGLVNEYLTKVCNIDCTEAELEPKDNDVDVLPRGSKYKDRLFLHKRKERNLVADLLVGDMVIEDFLQCQELNSDNIVKLLIPILRRIHEFSPEHIPKPYHRLLRNVIKQSTVSGYSQDTH